MHSCSHRGGRQRMVAIQRDQRQRSKASAATNTGEGDKRAPSCCTQAIHQSIALSQTLLNLYILCILSEASRGAC